MKIKKKSITKCSKKKDKKHDILGLESLMKRLSFNEKSEECKNEEINDPFNRISISSKNINRTKRQTEKTLTINIVEIPNNDLNLNNQKF